MPKTIPVERVEKKKKQLNQKKNALLKKALTRFKFKDTYFCPQKRNTLLTNVRFMAPRKPDSAVRKIFWSTFANPFWSKDFFYLPGEGLKTESSKVHGAEVKKFKFYGLRYKKILNWIVMYLTNYMLAEHKGIIAIQRQIEVNVLKVTDLSQLINDVGKQRNFLLVPIYKKL